LDGTGWSHLGADVVRNAQISYFLVTISDLWVYTIWSVSGMSSSQKAGTLAKYSKALFDSTVYPNEGTTARDHLANERTFLAWLRTGLTVSALGVALARFSIQLVNNPIFSKVLGAFMVVLGMWLILVGLVRYVQVKTRLEENKYPAAGPALLLVAVPCFAAFIAAFVLVITTHATAPVAM
jgi:putative membrane protein